MELQLRAVTAKAAKAKSALARVKEQLETATSENAVLRKQHELDEATKAALLDAKNWQLEKPRDSGEDEEQYIFSNHTGGHIFTPELAVMRVKKILNEDFSDDEALKLLAEYSFDADDLGMAVESADNGHFTAMETFAWKGNLPMMRWLCSRDAACRAEIVATGEHHTDGETERRPLLHIACQKGHLRVVKWLIQEMQPDQVRPHLNIRAPDSGVTCMYVACTNNYLDIAKLLFENGAAITEDPSGGPLTGGLLSSGEIDKKTDLIMWLISQGWLNDPVTGHITQAIVRPNLYLTNFAQVSGLTRDMQRMVLSRAQGRVLRSKSFFNDVLMGSFYPDVFGSWHLLTRHFVARGLPKEEASALASALPEPAKAAYLAKFRPRTPFTKLRGSAGPLELVADFLGGIARGRELRDARELVECLEALGVRSTSSSAFHA